MKEKKQKKAANKSLWDKIQAVNALLKAQEPLSVAEEDPDGMIGYKVQFTIDAMNHVFGVGHWSVEDLSGEIEHEVFEVSGKAKRQVAVSKVKVRIDGSDVQSTAYGQSPIVAGNYGDAKKGAQSDAMKKALAFFSIATRSFSGELNAQTPRKKGKATGFQCSKCGAGISKEEDKFTRGRYKKPLCRECVKKNGK